MKVRTSEVDGKSNHNGKFEEIRAIITRDMGDEFFMSLCDLKRIGALDFSKGKIT